MSGQCVEPPTGVPPASTGSQSPPLIRRGPAPPGLGAGDSQPDSEAVIARRLRARGLVAGQPPTQIAGVIWNECGPVFGTTWIRAYRLALGITLADVVEQVRAWYQAEDREQPRFSETLLSAYESGQKRPGPGYLHYLCAVYGADPQDLGYQGRCFCGTSHRSPSGAPAWTAPRPDRAVELASGPSRLEGAFPGQDAPAGDETPPWVSDDDSVLRRALLQLIAGAPVSLDTTFFGAVDRVRRRMDDALLRGSVSVTMLDQWEETVVGYGRQYMTVPPLRLLCDVLLDLGDIRRMCEQRQPIEATERLCRLATQLSTLTGMIMINIGDQRTARSFFRTARTAADETSDRSLRAWVAAREALIPLYYGDPREAVDLARAGADLAGRSPSVAAVMAPVAEARALSRIVAQGRRGALSRAQRALDRAAGALDALPPCQRSDTAFGYTERQFLFHRGDVLVALGDYRGAQEAFGQSLRLYSPGEFLDRSLVKLGMAQCQLEADEPEEALRISRDMLLDLPREHRAEIVVAAARTLGESAASRYSGLPALREYRSALHSS